MSASTMRNVVRRLRSRLFSAVGLGIILSIPTANAASINDCRGIDVLPLLMEPVEDHSGTFHGGKVWVAALDIGGDPCCSQAILVRVLTTDPALRLCRIITPKTRRRSGWMRVVVAKTKTPDHGDGRLRLHVPIRIFHSQDQIWDLVEVVIDPADARVGLE